MFTILPMLLGYISVLIPPHELPDQGESERWVPIIQVLPPDAHQREIGFGLPQFHGVVTVLQLDTQKHTHACRDGAD